MLTFRELLNPVYFWDIDLNSLDENKSMNLIIERTITFGNLREIKSIIDYYGEEEVKKTICGINKIDPKTLNFCSIVFDIPKSSFKCYKRKPSINNCWT